VESRKDALIIDARWNCGGHVSYHLLNMLRNKSLGFVKCKREIKDPIPDNSNSGVMVCLMNQDSGSDGDIFSHEFKTYKLGKTIGTRTWGGVIGIMPDSSEFVDKGQTNQPEYATIYYDMQGNRDLENYGVEPEIVVENPVNWSTCKEDAQLNRGIKELMDELV
jgi:tricorn protease